MEGNKSQGKDITSFKSTISCDKNEKKESKESIDECKEIDQEELKRILEHEKTTTAPFSWQCWRHVGDTSATCRKFAKFGSTCDFLVKTKTTLTQEFCIGNHRQIVDTVVRTDTVVHTPRGGKIL
jgi:hypothetical protein